jgi:hypothetical protein
VGRSPSVSNAPRRRGLVLATAVWGAFLLEPISDAGIGFPMGLMALLGTGLLGAVWLGVLAADRASGIRCWRWLAWLVLPLAGIGVAVIFLTTQSPMNPLFRLRFVLSRSALHGVAVAPSVRPASSPPGWVGLFRVQRVDRFGGDVHFVTVSCGVVDECGIAYIPGPPPRRLSKTRLTPLGGAWYHLYSVF